MIYTVQICGLALAKLHISAFYAIGRTQGERRGRSMQNPTINYEPGTMVFETYENAAEALGILTYKTCHEHNRKELHGAQKWIVLGVEANWHGDTGNHVFLNFPKARDLLFQRPLIEIEQRLIQ